MRTVKIIRIEQGADGTFGAVTIDGIAFCVSLELPWIDNQEHISCIPAGHYYCDPYRSNKFGDTFIVSNVPQRSAILLHPGNFIADTHGCILLGQYWDKLRGERAIKNSGKTFDKFMLEFRYEYGFHLHIVGCEQWQKT
jgi:hypothetical protein